MKHLTPLEINCPYKDKSAPENEKLHLNGKVYFCHCAELKQYEKL